MRRVLFEKLTCENLQVGDVLSSLADISNNNQIVDQDLAQIMSQKRQ